MIDDNFNDGDNHENYNYDEDPHCCNDNSLMIVMLLTNH